MSLELAVSQVLMRAHALERALHDDGPWTVWVDTPRQHFRMGVPATRKITDNSVIFTFPYVMNDAGECRATLCCRGDEVLVTSLWVSGYGIANIDWEVQLADSVAA